MPDPTGCIRRPVRAALSCWITLLLVACQSPADPVQARDLTLAATDLASLASEAALLTEQLDAGAVTENFTWVHQQALGRASLDITSRLARPVPAPIQPTHEHLLQLQARFDTALERVGFAAHDPAVLAQLRSRFRQIGAEAKP